MKSANINLDKIVVNVGVGRLSSQQNFEDKVLPEVVKELSLITGQKPSVRSAKKSIAGFKLRSGTVVGLKVTLRRKRMADFLSKLLNSVLPRLRDFRGLPETSVDSSGNLTIGIKDYSVFPEINLESSRVNFGLEVTLVPKVWGREKAVAVYKELGVPWRKHQ